MGTQLWPMCVVANGRSSQLLLSTCPVDQTCIVSMDVPVGLLGCESLIRKMLVRDPRKRLTIVQIGQHPWMQEASADVRRDPLAMDASSQDGQPYNEHVLHLMHSLNIDENKTLEVCIFSRSDGISRRYGDGAGNTVEENSGVFSLIRVC